MALDLFIHWKDRIPRREDIVRAIHDYMGDCGEINDDNSRLFVTLPGKPSSLFGEPCRDDERWFEICFGDDHISVITRQQDKFTNVVAQGFAVAVASYWAAEYKP